MKDENMWDLLGKYLGNECSEEEKKEVQEWLNSDPSNSNFYKELQETWKITQGIQLHFQPNLEIAWQKINAEIKSVEKQTGKESKRYRYNLLPKIWRIAAVFIIGIALYLFYNQFFKVQTLNKIEISNTLNNIKKFDLPDGSQVWLNTGSKIEYTENFTENVRELSLSGEAFFDIAKDSSKPFIVNGQRTIVKVLGTSFVYRSVQAEDSDIVIVNSGKVSFYEKENSRNSSIIESGYKAVFNHQSKYIGKMMNMDENYFSIKTGRLIFESDRLEKVISELSRYYKRRFVIEDQKLNDIRLTVAFDNQSIGEVLKILEITLDKNIIDSQEVITIR
jgi:ferric-dicitrate binding protein FerR (iron transport regulator)